MIVMSCKLYSYVTLNVIISCSGPTDAAVRAMRGGLRPAMYEDVALSREQWQRQRGALAPSEGSNARVVHYITVASEETAELGNLRLSAALADVHLTVSNDARCVYIAGDLMSFTLILSIAVGAGCGQTLLRLRGQTALVPRTPVALREGGGRGRGGDYGRLRRAALPRHTQGGRGNTLLYLKSSRKPIIVTLI